MKTFHDPVRKKEPSDFSADLTVSSNQNPYRIFLAVPFLILFLLLLSSGLSWWQFEGFRQSYLEETEKELAFQCQLILPMLEKREFEKIEEFCHIYSRHPWRISIFDEKGNIIQESDCPPTNTNQLHEPEVHEALVNRTAASSFRFSRTMEEWRHYYALPVQAEGELFILRLSIPGKPLSTLLNRIAASVLYVMLLGAALALFLIFHIIYRLTFPLIKLQESAIQIANGNLSEAVFVPEKGVVRPLSLAVFHMARQLRLKIRDMLVLESFRSEFVANVSHEVKTPLTGILSAVETLEDGAKDIPNVRDRCLKILRHQSDRLHALIQDILSLSALEQKQKTDETEIKAEFQTIFAAQMFQNAVTNCAESIENAGIQTEILANESLKFDGDSKLIEMAITNLLVNAVRYSGSPKILLSAQCDENKIILSVRDFGIGIHPENSQRIFERFYRVHKERSRELGGTGLGLAIVKHTAQLHGGYAEVKSEPGKGADFRLILPFQQ